MQCKNCRYCGKERKADNDDLKLACCCERAITVLLQELRIMINLKNIISYDNFNDISFYNYVRGFSFFP